MNRLLGIAGLVGLAAFGWTHQSTVVDLRGGQSFTPNVLATPTATGAPRPIAVIRSADWRLVDGPGAPNGNLRSAFCLTERRCWVGGTDNRDYGDRRGFLFATADGGATWTLRQSFVVHADLVFLDELRGFSGGYRTFDGGETWERVVSQQGDPLYQIRPAGIHTVYACSRGTTLYRSDDAGASWHQWGGACFPPSAIFLDSDIAWGNGPRSELWYTTDGWRSWVDLRIEGPDELVGRLDFVDYRHGWVGYTRFATVDGQYQPVAAGLYATADSGATWEPRLLPPQFSSVGLVDFVTPQIGWVTAYRPRSRDGWVDMVLLRTTDGGRSWIEELEIRKDDCVGCQAIAGLTYFFNDRMGLLTAGKWNPIVCCYYSLYRYLPGVALTPTPTPTPTTTPSPTTPTPTRTPFVPVIPIDGPPTRTPTQPPESPQCNWAGAWDTVYSVGVSSVILLQSGSAVTGTYDGLSRVEASATESRLLGRWFAPPTFKAPTNTGQLTWSLSENCEEFHGTWGFGESTIGGTWVGFRGRDSGAKASVWSVYQNVLGRTPDSTGLASWAGTGLSHAELRKAIEISPEGQRVFLIRMLYREWLLRDPLGDDNRGLRSWVDAPISLGEVESALLASAEGQRIRIVRSLYRELLEREGTWQEIRGWALTALSDPEMREAFLASPEYRACQTQG